MNRDIEKAVKGYSGAATPMRALERGRFGQSMQALLKAVHGALLLPMMLVLIAISLHNPSAGDPTASQGFWFLVSLSMLSMVAYALSCMPVFQQHRVILMSLGVALAGIPFIWLWHNVNPANSSTFFAGVGLLLLWIYTLPQLGFRAATLVSWGLSILSLLIIPGLPALQEAAPVTDLMLVISANLIGMSSSLNSHRDRTRLLNIIHSLYEKATTDQVTGAYNRHQFVELAERECARAKRLGKPLAMLLVDIDHFKTINDDYGHPVGDRALCLLTDCLNANIREVDICGRYGGDEFAVVLTDSTPKAAMAIAQRILSNIGELELGDRLRPIPFSISIGVAGTTDARCSLDALISHADQALYQAKMQGRNRAHFAKV